MPRMNCLTLPSFIGVLRIVKLLGIAAELSDLAKPVVSLMVCDITVFGFIILSPAILGWVSSLFACITTAKFLLVVNVIDLTIRRLSAATSSPLTVMALVIQPVSVSSLCIAAYVRADNTFQGTVRTLGGALYNVSILMVLEMMLLRELVLVLVKVTMKTPGRPTPMEIRLSMTPLLILGLMIPGLGNTLLILLM